MEVGYDTPYDAEPEIEGRYHDLCRGLQTVHAVLPHILYNILKGIASRIAVGYVVWLPLSHDSIHVGCAAAVYAPPECGQRFERTHRCGAYGRDVVAAVKQVLQRVETRLEVFGVHRMLRRVVALDRKECPRTDVERHGLEFESFAAHALDELLGKVESCRGCGDRTLEFGIYGLVTRQVDLLALAVEVGRDGYASEVFEQLAEGHVGIPREAYDMLARAPLGDTGRETACAPLIFEWYLHIAILPLLQIAYDAAPAAGAARGKGPLVVGRIVRLEAEDLDARTRCLVHDDACAYDLRVVEYDERRCRQLLVDMAETALADGAVAVDEQFRVAAVRKRELGYALLRQRIIEIVYVDVTFHCGCFGGKVTKSRLNPQYLDILGRAANKTAGKNLLFSPAAFYDLL